MTVFSLAWHQDHSEATAYERPAGSALTHLAVTSPTNAETLAAVAQASTYAPWSGLRRVNLWDDGTVTAYYGDRCYTDTDVANMGQVMVQIPKFWYTSDHTAPDYIWYISDTGADALPAGADHAWAVHPAFIRNGATKDYIYLGAYEAYLNGVGMLESRAAVAPKVTYTLANFRIAAHARVGVANKWELQDFLTTSAVQLLYLIEYGGFNSQLLLGRGITNDTALHNTGETAIGAAHSSNNASYGTVANYTSVMSYRGIENFYGNIFTLVDGYNIKANRMPWIADHDFISDTFTHPYVDSTLTLPVAANNFITDIAPGCDYGFIPATVNGAGGATYLCDSLYISAGNKVAALGGSFGSFGPYAGAFNWSIDSAIGSTGANMGARLLYIP